jgi:hypothetical protein
MDIPCAKSWAFGAIQADAETLKKRGLDKDEVREYRIC